MDCMNCIVEGSCFRMHQSGYSSLSALGDLSQLLPPPRPSCCPVCPAHDPLCLCQFSQREQRQGEILSPRYFFSAPAIGEFLHLGRCSRVIGRFVWSQELGDLF